MNSSISVTTTKQSLYTILAAIDANAPRNVTMVEVRGDDAQSAPCYVGGTGLADNDYAFIIETAGDIFRDASQNDKNIISLNQIFIKAKDATATQTVHCRVRVF